VGQQADRAGAGLGGSHHWVTADVAAGVKTKPF